MAIFPKKFEKSAQIVMVIVYRYIVYVSFSMVIIMLPLALQT